MNQSDAGACHWRRFDRLSLLLVLCWFMPPRRCHGRIRRSVRILETKPVRVAQSYSQHAEEFRIQTGRREGACDGLQEDPFGIARPPCDEKVVGQNKVKKF